MALNRSRPRRGEAGLTLIEMLIAVALLGIVLLGIAPLFISSMRFNYSALSTRASTPSLATGSNSS